MNIETMRLLVAKGLSADDILEIAEAMGVKARSSNAERQARFRARKRGDNTVTSNVTDNGVTPPIEEIIPPKQSFPDGKACTTKPRSKPMVMLPDDWQPVLTPAAQRVVDGWPPGMLDRQLSAFRNHAADKGRKSKDWQAAFRTWIDNADKWKNRDDRQKPGQSPPNYEPTNPYVRATLARQAERSAEIGGQPDSWP